MSRAVVERFTGLPAVPHGYNEIQQYLLQCLLDLVDGRMDFV